MKLNFALTKSGIRNEAQRRSWVERFFLQHAFSVFLGSLILLFAGFLAFFYQFFYTSVSGKASDDASTLRTIQKSVNLGLYGQIVDLHRTKTDSGKDFATGTTTAPNPFSQE